MASVASVGDLAGDGTVGLGQRRGQPPTEDAAHQFQGLGRDGPAPPARPAQHTALDDVEGHEAVALPARHALVDHGRGPLEGQDLEAEGGHQERGVTGVEGAQGPHHHVVEPGIGVALLGELVGDLEHGVGLGHPGRGPRARPGRCR